MKFSFIFAAASSALLASSVNALNISAMESQASAGFGDITSDIVSLATQAGTGIVSVATEAGTGIVNGYGNATSAAASIATGVATDAKSAVSAAGAAVTGTGSNSAANMASPAISALILGAAVIGGVVSWM